MKLHDLKPAEGSKHRKTRKGRGEAAGKGKTAGRGTKGTGARKNVKAGFEGGQIPLQRRLPKLPGFTPRNRIEYQAVNLLQLDEHFNDGDTVNAEALVERGILRKTTEPYKVLARGEITKKLTVVTDKVSASAKSAIEAAGGSVELKK